MGKKLREAPPDTFFHVTARGNRKQLIHLDDHDYAWHLALLAKVVERFEWNLLAYCLMGNHFHLSVHTPRQTLSAGMQHLNGVYAQRFNWRHCYEGHLFERPFRSVIATSDEQLKTQIRYVLLNPVAAGICALPGDWPWSSYRATVGYVPAPRFLALGRVAALFSGGRADWRVRFAEFVAAGIDPSGRVHGPGPGTRLDPPPRGAPARRSPAALSGGTSRRARPAARGARTGA